MPLDPKPLLNYPHPQLWEPVTAERAILYALSVGVGDDPLDPRQLRYVYERELAVLPTFAVLLGARSEWMTDPEIGLNITKLVHGDQSVRIHRPLKAGEQLLARYQITSVSDKGPSKGALIRTRCVFETASGALAGETENGFFFRGDGGFGGENLPSEPEPRVPDRAADIVQLTVIAPHAALLYRLTGDLNPLHIDPAVSASAGFPRPILHGSCTFGIACRIILERVCNYKSEALRYIRTRYSAPVMPGETIRTEIWIDGTAVQFRTSVVERDVMALTGGVAEINPS